MPNPFNIPPSSEFLELVDEKPRVTTSNVRGVITPSDYSYDSDIESYNKFIDRDFAYNPALKDMYNDSRAVNQSGLANFAKSIPKMFVYAGTTFGDAVLGTAVGLGQGTLQALQGKGFSDGFANGFINNAFSKAMVDIQAWSDKTMPVYMTSKESETNPFARAFGLGGSRAFLNFWGDSILKNTGFALGAIAGSMATYGAGTASLASSAGRYAGKKILRKAALELGEASVKGGFDDLARIIATKSDDAANILAKASMRAKGVENFTSKFIGLGLSSAAEARFEAIHTYDEVYDNLIAQGVSEAEAANQAQSASNITFMTNLAILGTSNNLQFGHLLTKGFGTKTLVRGITGDPFKGFTVGSTSKLGKILDYSKVVGRTIQGGIREGAEEGSQFIASTFAKEFTDRWYNQEADESVAQMIQEELYHSIKELGSNEGLENIAAGFFTGIIGLPNMFKLINQENRKDKNQSYWTGGLHGEISEIRKNRNEAELLASEANQISNRVRSYAEANNITLTEDNYKAVYDKMTSEKAFSESLLLRDKENAISGFKQEKLSSLPQEFQTSLKAIQDLVGSPEFEQQYNNIVHNWATNKSLETAISENNKFDYLNNKAKILTQDVYTYAKIGAVNDFIKDLRNLAEGKIDVQSYRESSMVEQEGKMIDPFENLTDEQVVEYAKKQAAESLTLAESALKYKEMIDKAALPTISEAVKRNIVEYGVMKDDAARRFNQLHSELFKDLETLPTTTVNIESLEDDYSKDSSKFKEAIDKAVTSAEFNDASSTSDKLKVVTNYLLAKVKDFSNSKQIREALKQNNYATLVDAINLAINEREYRDALLVAMTEKGAIALQEIHNQKLSELADIQLDKDEIEKIIKKEGIKPGEDGHYIINLKNKATDEVYRVKYNKSSGKIVQVINGKVVDTSFINKKMYEVVTQKEANVLQQKKDISDMQNYIASILNDVRDTFVVEYKDTLKEIEKVETRLEDIDVQIKQWLGKLARRKEPESIKEAEKMISKLRAEKEALQVIRFRNERVKENIIRMGRFIKTINALPELTITNAQAEQNLENVADILIKNLTKAAKGFPALEKLYYQTDELLLNRLTEIDTHIDYLNDKIAQLKAENKSTKSEEADLRKWKREWEKAYDNILKVKKITPELFDLYKETFAEAKDFKKMITFLLANQSQVKQYYKEQAKESSQLTIGKEYSYLHSETDYNKNTSLLASSARERIGNYTNGSFIADVTPVEGEQFSHDKLPDEPHVLHHIRWKNSIRNSELKNRKVRLVNIKQDDTLDDIPLEVRDAVSEIQEYMKSANLPQGYFYIVLDKAGNLEKFEDKFVWSTIRKPENIAQFKEDKHVAEYTKWLNKDKVVKKQVSAKVDDKLQNAFNKAVEDLESISEDTYIKRGWDSKDEFIQRVKTLTTTAEDDAIVEALKDIGDWLTIKKAYITMLDYLGAVESQQEVEVVEEVEGDTLISYEDHYAKVMNSFGKVSGEVRIKRLIPGSNINFYDMDKKKVRFNLSTNSDNGNHGLTVTGNNSFNDAQGNMYELYVARKKDNTSNIGTVDHPKNQTVEVQAGEPVIFISSSEDSVRPRVARYRTMNEQEVNDAITLFQALDDYYKVDRVRFNEPFNVTMGELNLPNVPESMTNVTLLKEDGFLNSLFYVGIQNKEKATQGDIKVIREGNSIIIKYAKKDGVWDVVNLNNAASANAFKKFLETKRLYVKFATGSKQVRDLKDDFVTFENGEFITRRYGDYILEKELLNVATPNMAILNSIGYPEIDKVNITLYFEEEDLGKPIVETEETELGEQENELPEVIEVAEEVQIQSKEEELKQRLEEFKLGKPAQSIGFSQSLDLLKSGRFAAIARIHQFTNSEATEFINIYNEINDKYEKSEKVQTTTSNQTEIEAKKAEIERRRREALSNIVLYYTSYGKTFKDELGNDRQWKVAWDNIRTKEGNLVDSESDDIPLEVRDLAEFNGITKEQVEKQINAKYDAELAALEETTPTEQIEESVDLLQQLGAFVNQTEDTSSDEITDSESLLDAFTDKKRSESKILKELINKNIVQQENCN